MPSPFPGMDPYLEHPGLWPGVHQGLIANARAALNSLLPAPYIADIGERLYVVEPERSIYPDVVSVERPAPPALTAQGSGGTAVALASDPAHGGAAPRSPAGERTMGLSDQPAPGWAEVTV